MITIAYITNRKQPYFEWFAESLTNQIKPEQEVEVLVVDVWHSQSREAYFDSKLPTSVKFSYPKPLPSFCQGPHRLTKTDWFSATIARNTAFAYAKGGYIVFVDDLSVLMQGWMDSAIEAAKGGYVVEGSYEKRNGLVVEHGLLVQSEELPNNQGKDVRLRGLNGAMLIRGHAGWLFGCSFGLPLSLALEVNGFDEMCSITGYEDTQFGHRLQKAGAQFYYDTRMRTIESAELHFTEGNYFNRIDPETDRDTYYRVLGKFGLKTSVYGHIPRYDASHVIVDCMKQLGHKAYWNNYDLKELREKLAGGAEITADDMHFPETWWFDDAALSTM